MKTRFDVGDRVRLVNPHYYDLHGNDIGEIVGNDHSYTPYWVDFGGRIQLWLREDEVEETESEWDVEDLL